MGCLDRAKRHWPTNWQKKMGATHLNADEVREQYHDWDFSDEGRLRQAKRMAKLAHEANTHCVIMDFVCPTKE